MTINENIKLAVGYTRCSTDMQDQSIPSQKTELLKYAEENGFRIIGWYDDQGRSGVSFSKRPAFMRMVKDAEKTNNFKYVLVFDESRFGRSQDIREPIFWKYQLEMWGVLVVVINSRGNGGSGISNYLMVGIEAAEAGEYSLKNSRATKRGQKENASKGYSSGGTAPYAFKRIAVSKTTGEFKRDLPPGVWSYPDEKVLFDLGDPFEVHIVKKIFNLKLGGFGYKAIANLLNTEGVPSAKRGRWKNKDQKWSASTIRSIITNETYTGKRIFNKHNESRLASPSKERWLNDEKDWIVRPNSHPAIISEEIFNQVNKDRKPHQGRNRHYYDSPYLLSGLLKCSSCGFAFQGQTRTLYKKSGQKYQRMYYQDSAYMSKGKSVCGSYLIRKERLENKIIKQIKSFIKEKDFLDKVRQVIEKKLLNNSEVDSLLANISKQIANSKSVLKNLLELLRNGVDLKEVQDEIIRLNKEIDFLERNYAEIKNKEVSSNDIDKLVDKVKKLADNFEITLKKSPLHVQKNLLRQFIQEIIVNPHEGTIECKLRKIPLLENKIIKQDIFGSTVIKIGIYHGIKADRHDV